MKGLKRDRETDIEDGADDVSIVSEDDADATDGVGLKRQRIA